MSIMNKVYRIVIICMSLLYLGACKEDRDIAGEQGTLQLSVGMSDKITVASRTLSSEEQTQLKQACKVRIYNETSLVRKYEGTDNVPSSIPLMSGTYSLGACKEDRDIAGEQGTLQLSVGMSDKITVASRTLSSEEQTQLKQACKVRIYNETSLVRKYEGTDNVPSSIPLMSGTYSVRVTAGDSVAASFDQRFFEGNEEFTITKGQQSPVEVKCGIANTVLAFTWDESLKEAFEGDCQVTVTSATGELVYSSANADAKGYFSLPADNRKLTCKFTATKLTGGTYEQTTELTDAQPATLYNMTCKYTATGQETTGGAWLTLSVDETPLSEKTTTIGIKQRPVIVCKGADNIEYDLEQPMYLATNTKGTYYLIVSTSSPLKGALLQNDRFTEFGVADNIEYDLEQPMYLATNTKGTYYLIVSTSSPLKGALLQNDRFTEFGVPANSMDLMNLGGKDASVEASGISLHAPNAIMETGYMLQMRLWKQAEPGKSSSLKN